MPTKQQIEAAAKTLCSSGAKIVEARSKLIRLASEMHTGKGMPSPYGEDHIWRKGCPKKQKQDVLTIYKQVAELNTQRASELKQIYDLLRTE